MGFLDTIKQQNAQFQSGGYQEAHFPSADLKHKELFFEREKNNQLLVRILPPATLGEAYYYPTRTISLKKYNPSSGKELKLNATLPLFEDVNSPLDQALAQWQAEDRMPGYFKNAKPRKTFLLNVVEVIQTPNGYEEKRDAQGNLEVRLLKLPQSAIEAINNLVQDPMARPSFGPEVPADVAEYSFISSNIAFPVSITKPLPGNMQYSVNTYANVPLQPLPQGWENLLENLEYQGTPTEQINADYVKMFIDTVNGVANGGGQANVGGVNPNQFSQPYQQPVQQQQPYQQPMNQMPPQQSYQQPINQVPTQPVQQQQYQQPVQQQYQQPINQEPVQQPNIQEPMQQQTQVQQPVQQQQQQQQQQTQQPVQQTDAPNVDDLLAQMGL